VPMNNTEAIEKLAAIDVSDYEAAHNEADEVLLELVPKSVSEAYRRLQERAKNWPTA
jgi:hypothetical protein